VPKGTKGKKRPADVIGAAVTVAKIATGEIEEKTGGEDKDKAAQELGRKGGAARAAKLSKKRRAEIAKKVAKATYTAAGVEFTDGEKPGMRLVPR
jgi:general stress protein YciG